MSEQRLMASKDTAYAKFEMKNSGGQWWLTDAQWRALAKAGWEVEWTPERTPAHYEPVAEGTPATVARLPIQLTGIDVTRLFEKATGEKANEMGCPCCGTPFWFSLHAKDGTYLAGYPDALIIEGEKIYDRSPEDDVRPDAQVEP